MGFSTMPMNLEEVPDFVNAGGDVVSASRLAYFDNTNWLQEIAHAEIKDDSETIIVTLFNGDFIEFTRAYKRR